MAKIERKTQKIFAGSANSDQLAVFATMKTGTPSYSTDIETLQSSAYLQGWNSGILDDKAPYLEEMNAIQYAFSKQIAYLLQAGIAEYDDGTTYYKGSLVTEMTSTDTLIYRSLVDDNVGNALSDTTKWSRYYITTTGYIGQPQFTFNYGADVLPVNCIWLDGSAVSRTLYSNLYAIYGTTYGSGDGSTTFNLPNLNDRVIWGGTTAGYISAGLPNHRHTLSVLGNAAASGVNTGVWGSGVSIPQTTSYASADNPIYGNSTTVQPPAIKCRAFTRYQ